MKRKSNILITYIEFLLCTRLRVQHALFHFNLTAAQRRVVLSFPFYRGTGRLSGLSKVTQLLKGRGTVHPRSDSKALLLRSYDLEFELTFPQLIIIIILRATSFLRLFALAPGVLLASLIFSCVFRNR